MRFLIWSSILITSLVLIGLAMRLLALHGVPLSESLFVRGVSCLLLVILFAQREKLSLWPKSIKTQCIRALIAGLALTLFALSYNWLTASTVSVLSNIDVPLLVALGPLIGMKASLRVRILSLVSILFLVWYVVALEKQLELLYGLASLMLACLLLCFGYFFIKKSMNEENHAIAILTPSLAIMIYGLCQCGLGMSVSDWTLELFIIDIVSGIGMFFAYIATMNLYAITDIANAEFPTLISSLVIQPFEYFFLNVPMQFNFILPSIAFVIMTYLLLIENNKNTHGELC